MGKIRCFISKGIYLLQGSTEEFHLPVQLVRYRQTSRKAADASCCCWAKKQVTFMLGQVLRPKRELAEVQTSSRKLQHTTGGRKTGIWSLKETLYGADLPSKGDLSCRGKMKWYATICYPSWVEGGWKNHFLPPTPAVLRWELLAWMRCGGMGRRRVGVGGAVGVEKGQWGRGR